MSSDTEAEVTHGGNLIEETRQEEELSQKEFDDSGEDTGEDPLMEASAQLACNYWQWLKCIGVELPAVFALFLQIWFYRAFEAGTLVTEVDLIVQLLAGNYTANIDEPAEGLFSNPILRNLAIGAALALPNAVVDTCSVLYYGKKVKQHYFPAQPLLPNADSRPSLSRKDVALHVFRHALTLFAPVSMACFAGYFFNFQDLVGEGSHWYQNPAVLYSLAAVGGALMGATKTAVFSGIISKHSDSLREFLTKLARALTLDLAGCCDFWSKYGAVICHLGKAAFIGAAFSAAVSLDPHSPAAILITAALMTNLTLFETGPEVLEIHDERFESSHFPSLIMPWRSESLADWLSNALATYTSLLDGLDEVIGVSLITQFLLGLILTHGLKYEIGPLSFEEGLVRAVGLGISAVVFGKPVYDAHFHVVHEPIKHCAKTFLGAKTSTEEVGEAPVKPTTNSRLCCCLGVFGHRREESRALASRNASSGSINGYGAVNDGSSVSSPRSPSRSSSTG